MLSPIGDTVGDVIFTAIAKVSPLQIAIGRKDGFLLVSRLWSHGSESTQRCRNRVYSTPVLDYHSKVFPGDSPGYFTQTQANTTDTIYPHNCKLCEGPDLEQNRRSILLVSEIRPESALDTATLQLRIQVNCKHRKAAYMDNIVTEEEMDYVADNISPRHSRRLLRKLGLKNVTIDQVFYDFEKDGSREQLVQGLWTCKEKKGSAFTLYELVNALQCIGRADLAEELQVEMATSSEEDAKLIQSRVIQRKFGKMGSNNCGCQVQQSLGIVMHILNTIFKKIFK
ncbi:uncharacterized protein LOC144926824 [Branchiostoma floridae x Branchiostoma belcheri]